MKLGIELDNVIYPWRDPVCTYYRMYKGFKGTDYEFWTNVAPNFSEEHLDFLRHVDAFYTAMLPSKSDIECIKRLDSKYDVYYITSRPSYVTLSTENFFRNAGIPLRENLFFSTEKSNDVRALGIDLFVESDIAQAFRLSQLLNTILFLAPWDNPSYYDGVGTTKTLADLEKIVDAYAA